MNRPHSLLKDPTILLGLAELFQTIDDVLWATERLRQTPKTTRLRLEERALECIGTGSWIAWIASRAAVRMARCCCALPASPTRLPAGKRSAIARGTPIEAVMWGCTDIEIVATPNPSTAFCTSPTER